MSSVVERAKKLYPNLSLELKPCKYCFYTPELFQKNAVTILRCCKCSHSARGYIVEFCVKTDKELKQAIDKLKDSWQERN